MVEGGGEGGKGRKKGRKRRKERGGGMGKEMERRRRRGTHEEGGRGGRKRKEEEEGRDGQQSKQSPWKFAGMTRRSFNEHYEYYFFLHYPLSLPSLSFPSPHPLLSTPFPSFFPLYTTASFPHTMSKILQCSCVQCCCTHSPGESLPLLLTTSAPRVTVQREHNNNTHCTSMYVSVSVYYIPALTH